MGLPLVATSDAHYLTREDAAAHDVLLCINTGKTLDDPNRMKFETEQFYVRSPEEMYAAMPGHEEALATSVADRRAGRATTRASDLGKRQLPRSSPRREDARSLPPRALPSRACTKRYGDNPPPAALERLEHELGIINRMGFASYFLIVWDFVRFAREAASPTRRAARPAGPWSATCST